jgi:hypothetical protein
MKALDCWPKESAILKGCECFMVLECRICVKKYIGGGFRGWTLLAF